MVDTDIPAPKQMTPTQQPKAQEPTPPASENKKLSFEYLWKWFWSYAGPIITLIGIWSYWTPGVSLSSGINLDPGQTFQTQFVVTNTGHVAVYEISFVCELVGNSMDVGELAASPGKTMPALRELDPGAAASRGCFTRSAGITGAMLKVTAHYHRPIIDKEDTVSTYFSVRTGASGSFLVPEATPNPEPPVLMRLG